MKTLKIYFKNEEIEKLYQKAGYQTDGSVGFDLACTKDLKREPNKTLKIDFGIIVKPPEGHHIELVSRSSTFKKYGLLLSNCIGIIDSDYCGAEDTLQGLYIDLGNQNAASTKEAYQVIPKGTRLAQIIMRKTEKFTIEKYIPETKSRGGYGSTGD